MKKQILTAVLAAALFASAAVMPVMADEAESENAAVTSETAQEETAQTDEASDTAQTDETQTTDEGVTANTTADSEEVVSETISSGNFQCITSAGGVKIMSYTGSEATVEIPETINELNVTGISEKAFEGNTSIKKVIMPYTITDIGSSAFQNCTSLEEIVISDNVQVINENTFEGCTALNYVKLPENLIVIYGSAFSDCSSLTNIEFPDKLQYLGEGAFYNCTALNNVKITKNLNDLNGSIFGGCTSLYDLTVDSENPYYTEEGNIIYSKDKTMLVLFPPAHTGMYEVPEGTLAIGYAAFYRSGLEQIILPDTLKTIENTAFARCTSLTSIDIPSSVTYMGGYAFSGCSSLQSVKLPSSLSEVKEYTFANCPALVTVVIPSTISTVGSNAFSGCSQDCTIVTDREGSAGANLASSAGMNCRIESESLISLFGADEPGEYATVSVVFNGEQMEFESAPRIVNDNTIVPMRAIFEKMGADVSWNETEYNVDATLNNTVINLSIGSNMMWKNGEGIELEAPAVIIDDLTFVPLRAVSEAFGAVVTWDDATKTVYIDFAVMSISNNEIVEEIIDNPENLPVFYEGDPNMETEGIIEGEKPAEEEMTQTPVEAVEEIFEGDVTGE